MKILDYQKKNLLKNGYCVIKNYLDIEEINNLNLAFLKKKKTKKIILHLIIRNFGNI